MRRDGPPGLLLVDAEPAQAGLMSAVAQRAGWRVFRAVDAGSAVQALEGAKAAGHRIDTILADLWSPDSDAMASVTALRQALPSLPLIIITAQDSADLAVRAMRAGAHDVLIKPLGSTKLLAALHAAMSTKPDQQGELRPMAEKWPEPLDFDGVVGTAAGFRRAVETAMKAAATPATILIEGESGVGKEVLAQAIHRASTLRNMPLVTVNCGAIPANLIESELFGHERGAFTGAFERRRGLFAQADGGTIFLDEIGELPADAQAKLLRVLQSGEIRPIGAAVSTSINVRVVAATNRRLSDDVVAGRFREDLFYRLAVVPVLLPPLRERREDIGALAAHLLDRIARQLDLPALSLDGEALALLREFDWPGNVRQLHNALFRAAIFSTDAVLRERDFPQIRQARATPHTPPANDDMPVAAASMPLAVPTSLPLFGPDGHVRPIEEIEADLIRLAIGHYRGRMTEVARRLRIGRSTLYRKLGELGIEQAS